MVARWRFLHGAKGKLGKLTCLRQSVIHFRVVKSVINSLKRLLCSPSIIQQNYIIKDVTQVVGCLQSESFVLASQPVSNMFTHRDIINIQGSYRSSYPGKTAIVLHLLTGHGPCLQT